MPDFSQELEFKVKVSTFGNESAGQHVGRRIAKVLALNFSDVSVQDLYGRQYSWDTSLHDGGLAAAIDTAPVEIV